MEGNDIESSGVGKKAIEEGADALECDVRLTADGHLVCVHDRRVNRTSNGRGAVSALELADLAALDFGSWKSGDEAPDWEVTPEDRADTSVLTLERLLELVADAGRPWSWPSRPSTPRAGPARSRNGCWSC